MLKGFILKCCGFYTDNLGSLETLLLDRQEFNDNNDIDFIVKGRVSYCDSVSSGEPLFPVSDCAFCVICATYRCFGYCILAYLYYDKVDKTKRTRSSTYNKYFEQNQYLNELSYPMKINDISKLENTNDDLAINVFGIQENTIKNIEPYRISKYLDRKHIIDLLYITDQSGNSHYILITKLANLLKNETHKNHNEICRKCLTLFISKDAMLNHYELCSKKQAQKLTLPKNKYIEFNKHYMKSKIPFSLFFDFESTLEKYSTCENNDSKSYEIKTERHIPNSYKMYLDSDHENIIESQLFSHFGEDSSKIFAENIKSLTDQFSEIFKNKRYNPENMIITDKQEQEFQGETNCYYCNKNFEEFQLQKVRDHDHYTGLYRELLATIVIHKKDNEVSLFRVMLIIYQVMI